MDLRLANGESGEDLAQWLLSEYSIGCIFMSGNLDEPTQTRLRGLSRLPCSASPLSRIWSQQRLTISRAGKWAQVYVAEIGAP